ncbi:hypothetical protein [Occultella gossypii]|uniref:Uncharacterized protein n=1 Tax=Occultella gossypii TaxID=2800820 RepID=A0ABS7SE98_9MICO|nr:hypothetical protein [Occultella gossypii]MBZ2198674.1 hypothetical protein [Occultella gossypii]
MSPWLVALLGLVALAVGIEAVLRAERRPRESRGHGSGGGTFGIIDEVFAPTRHEALQELERQREMLAPAPTPGDPPWGTFVYGEDGAIVAVELTDAAAPAGAAPAADAGTAGRSDIHDG